MTKTYQISEIYKKSAVIHMEHKVSLVGLKLFNVLLSNAFHELKTKREHQITLKDLFNAVPSAKNTKNLKATLQSMSVSVAFNIFDKDHDVWGTFSLLPFALIDEKKGVCRYSFVEQVTELLINAVMYTKINLLIQKSYKGGKYGWSLYELCLDYKKINQTPVFTLDEIKRYLGIGEDKYKRYKDFHHWVLKVAIKDINSKTDLIISLKVYKKTGRTVTHIQFVIQPNTKFILPVKPEDVSSERIIYNDMNCEVAVDLKKIGVTSDLLYELIGAYTHDQIKESILVFREEEAKKGVEFPDKFIKLALKEAWESKATKRRRLSIISLEADKKAFKAKDEELKQIQAEQFLREEQDEELYEESARMSRFNLCLKSMMSDLKGCYEELDKDTKLKFRLSIKDIFLPGPSFKDTRVLFMDELIKFLKER